MFTFYLNKNPLIIFAIQHQVTCSFDLSLLTLYKSNSCKQFLAKRLFRIINLWHRVLVFRFLIFYFVSVLICQNHNRIIYEKGFWGNINGKHLILLEMMLCYSCHMCFQLNPYKTINYMFETQGYLYYP